MEFRLFDSHCHLYMPQFDADRGEVLARMGEQGVGAVVIGVDLASSRAALELARQYDFLWSSVGLHPNDNPTEVFDMEKFEELAGNPKVVGIGECGLDYFRSGGTDEERTAQKDRFLNHVELAEKVGKPLIIHCRNAHEDMLAILAEKKLSVPVIIHFFTGSGELAQRYIDLGCYLSFPGPVTYTDLYDDSIRTAPLDKILIETDAPYAAPVPHRGKRNDPGLLGEVARKVAAIKGIPEEEVIAATVKNAQKVFNVQA